MTRASPSSGPQRRGLQIAHFYGRWPVPIHSAHVGSVYRVHYQWHAYFGADVKIYRFCRRGDGTYVGLERDPGVAVMAPAWVLEASICQMMTLGPPRVSTTGLLELSAVLTSHDFRRSFGESDSSKEAEHDVTQDNQSDPTAPAISPASDSIPKRSGANDTDASSCATAAGSGLHGTGGVE